MNEPSNPYAPPTTRVADHDGPTGPNGPGRFIPYGRTRPAGSGAAWIGDAWRLLRACPGQWALALVLLLVAYIVLSMIPLVNFFVQLLVPFAYAGIAMAADEQRRTGSFEPGVLVAAVKKQPGALLAVGGTVLVASLVIFLFAGIVIGIDAFRMMNGGHLDPSTFFSLKYLLVFLICLALLLPVGMATYLAPQLIVLHDVPAVTAMKMSLVGTAKNILAGLVFGICGFLLFIVSMIPLLLGLFISIPILAITNYTVYRDIFVEDDE